MNDAPQKCTIFNVGKKLSYFKESGQGFVHKVNAIWFFPVVCAGNEMKNSVFKELLVCECVYLSLKEKKLLYMYFLMNISNAREACFES